MRNLINLGSTALVVLLIMFAGGLVLWVGIPVGWLWVGSQVEVATGSLGAAVAVMMVGVIASIALMVPVLGWLSNRHRAIRLARGLEDVGNLALEIVLVGSATLALLLFGGWFLLFSGSSPIPLNISY